MNVEVRLFIHFKNYLPPGSQDGKAILSIQEGATLTDLYTMLGIPVTEPKIVVLNGISQGTSPEINTRALNEGDIVSLFPPIGGG
jgi:molybdopterin converting factor small subunit